MNKSIEDLDVCIIGLGTIGKRYVRIFCENLNPRSLAVYDIDETKSIESASQHGIKMYNQTETMLEKENPDIVIVATPDSDHELPVKLALESNANVLVEKPLATNLKAAVEMVELAKEKKLTLMVNYSQRFETEYRWIKSQIDSGKIGKPIMFCSKKYDTIYVPTKMINWPDQTSPIFFMTSHDLDLICWYLNTNPIEVYAQEVKQVLRGKNIDAHDGVHAVVRFECGATAMFHSSWIMPDTYPTVAGGSMDIMGTEGFINYSMNDRKLAIYTKDLNQEMQFSGAHTADNKNEKLEGAFVTSVQSFIDTVINCKESDLSGRNTLHITQAQCAMIRSIKENTIITL